MAARRPAKQAEAAGRSSAGGHDAPAPSASEGVGPVPPGDPGSPPPGDAGALPPRWDDVDWESYSAGDLPPRPGRGPDLAPLFLVLDALRGGLPRHVSDQFSELLREILLTLRALIDWYLERLDRGPREARVEDIPID